MKDTRVLLDAFADARRSWDELVGLQPDIYAGGGNLGGLDMPELARRVETHQAAPGPPRRAGTDTRREGGFQ